MITVQPIGLDEIIDVFGDIDQPDFEAKNIVLFNLPYKLIYNKVAVSRSQCHRLAVDNFIEVFNRIKCAGLENKVKNYGGIYNRRSIAGRPSFASTHSWGIAIDLEPGKYPFGSKDRFSDEIIKIFDNCGFFYGGNFKSRLDPMHFQLCRGY